MLGEDFAVVDTQAQRAIPTRADSMRGCAARHIDCGLHTPHTTLKNRSMQTYGASDHEMIHYTLGVEHMCEEKYCLPRAQQLSESYTRTDDDWQAFFGGEREEVLGDALGSPEAYDAFSHLTD